MRIPLGRSVKSLMMFKNFLEVLASLWVRLTIREQKWYGYVCFIHMDSLCGTASCHLATESDTTPGQGHLDKVKSPWDWCMLPKDFLEWQVLCIRNVESIFPTGSCMWVTASCCYHGYHKSQSNSSQKMVCSHCACSELSLDHFEHSHWLLMDPIDLFNP